MAEPTTRPSAPSRVSAMYERLYGTRPRKAAQKLHWLGEQISVARAAGDQKTADQYDEARAALEAILSQRACCRCCGRDLHNPDSVRDGIGPECQRKKP